MRAVSLWSANLGSSVARVGKSDLDASAIAGVVKSAIEESGRSQGDVAQSAGISLGVLRSRLAGRTTFLITELAAIADVLEVPLPGLFARATSTQHNPAAQAGDRRSHAKDPAQHPRSL